MFRFLRDKFIGLGRDEDGAALVITLAFFMFLYVLFLGIWAVGTNVRTRIHLQNACDAAAYSAAVVQADTLSRIATINRAMSWTYAQMTKRQMDYIVYKWLGHTCAHYEKDREDAEDFANKSPPACERHGKTKGCGWDITDIVINGHEKNPVSESMLKSHCGSGFSSHLQNVEEVRSSFYSHLASTKELASQIQEDKATVSRMGVEIRTLANDLPGKVEAVAETIASVNMAGVDVKVIQSANPLLEKNASEGYLTCLHNNNDDECRFLSFSNGERPESADGYFGAGAGTWFVRGNERAKDGARGLQRSYCHYDESGHRDGKLYSSWNWYATKWDCGEIGGFEYHVPYDWKTICEHGHLHCRCVEGRCEKGSYTSKNKVFRGGMLVGLKIIEDTLINQWMTATCYADNDKIYSVSNYVGAVADPLVLTAAYFGKAGTITVGLVADNQNPWSWLGDVAHQGLLSAFEPFLSKTFCVASAKAGYRNFNADASFGRDYRIDWRGENPDDPDDEENWNLYTSDWDAVMIPVPRAASQATGGAWMTMGDALSEVASKLGLSEDDFRAGGTHVYTVKFTKDDEEDAYYWNQYLDLTVKDYVKRGAAVRAKWQIENPGRAISSWSELQKRMWH